MNDNQLLTISLALAISLGIVKDQGDFGHKLGYKNKSSFSQIMNGKTPASKKLIDNVKSLDPRIKQLWDTGVIFLKGDGSYDIEAMSNVGLIAREPNIEYESKQVYNKLLKEKDLRIQDKETIIRDKDEIIKLLKEKLDIKRGAASEPSTDIHRSIQGKLEK